jgi:hypothetical protein
MSTHMRFFLLSVLVFTGCTTANSATSPVPAKGKPTAPVEVKAELSKNAAKLTVTFESDSKDVKIAVSGVDGLVVQGEAVIVENGTFTRGDATSFSVNFTPGEGRSQLVVSVSGSFNGASRARVASFTIGDGPLPQNGEVMTTDDGEKVKVMPAAPQ